MTSSRKVGSRASSGSGSLSLKVEREALEEAVAKENEAEEEGEGSSMRRRRQRRGRGEEEAMARVGGGGGWKNLEASRRIRARGEVGLESRARGLPSPKVDGDLSSRRVGWGRRRIRLGDVNGVNQTLTGGPR